MQTMVTESQLLMGMEKAAPFKLVVVMMTMTGMLVPRGKA